MREEVRRFAALMEHRLRTSADWKQDDPAELIETILDETANLQASFYQLESKASTIKDAVALASVCLMLVDVLGGLTFEVSVKEKAN